MLCQSGGFANFLGPSRHENPTTSTESPTKRETYLASLSGRIKQAPFYDSLS